MSDLRVLEYLRSDDGVWTLPRTQLDALRAEFPDVRIDAPEDLAGAEALLPEADVVLGWAVRPGNFDRARRLRWIHVTAAGVGPFLFPALADSDVVFTNGRGLHADAMAEHTMAVLLTFARKLHLARDAQRAHRWAHHEMWTSAPPLRELRGSTLGLVGFGAVGHAIAERARGLGMRVLAVRRRPSPDPAPADAQWGTERLPELLAASDWVVLVAALTAETRGIIGADALARMNPGAVLVNLGRGGLVDEVALVESLASGQVAGAALDVFHDEPLPSGSPLWSMPQVLVTPHVSGLGPRYWERAMETFTFNLRAFRTGQPMRNVVDKRAGY